MRVRDLMTSPVHVIGSDAPAWEAVALMRRHRIRRLPVVDSEELIGILTWTDMVRFRPPALGNRWIGPNLAAAELPVQQLMTASPVTVRPDVPVEEAAALMRRRKVGALPVVDEGRVVGIVTESDLFDVFVEMFALGPREVRLHVPIASAIVLVPRIIAQLVRAGVPILSFHTLRVHGSEAVDVVVRERDEAPAREALRTLALDVETERTPEHSKEI